MERYFKKLPSACAPSVTSRATTRRGVDERASADALQELPLSTSSGLGSTRTSQTSRLSSPMSRLQTPASSPKRPAESETGVEPAKRARAAGGTADLVGVGEPARATTAGDGAGPPRTVSSSSAEPLREPMKIVTWNCNGLGSRLASADDLKNFVGFVQKEDPDVVFLQEVRLPAAGPPGCKPGDGQPRNRAKVHVGTGKKGCVDSNLLTKAFHSVGAPLAKYRPYWSLADKKYAGSGALIKRSLKPRSVRFSLEDDEYSTVHAASMGPQAAGTHDPEGRIILLEFPSFQLLATYSPNNGTSDEYFKRRRDWDASITAFVRKVHERAVSKPPLARPLIYVGDLNCAATDADLSHPSYFRNIAMDDQRGVSVLPENQGQPGCTPAERTRFAAMLKAGRLTDVYRSLAPAGREPNFTWRGTPGRDVPAAGRYYGKGMRIDHLLVSDLLLGAAPDGASGIDPRYDRLTLLRTACRTPALASAETRAHD
jgi:exonuclease III